MKHTRNLLVLALILGISIISNAPAQPAQDYQEGGCLSDLTEPLNGTMGYTFITDYMFRGLNMSDILGGHVGRGNHELSYGLSLDLAEVGYEDIGEVGFTIKHGLMVAYQNTTANLALTDMSLSLTRPCQLLEEVDGTVMIEWRTYKWQNQNTYTGGNERTQEFSVSLAFEDGAIIEALTGKDMGENVLNPTIKWIIDYDLADGGQLWQFGISHPIDMAQCMPELSGIMLKPSWTISVDNRYYGSYIKNLTNGAVPTQDVTKLAYMDWGVSAGADLTETIGLNCGKLGIQGGIGFVQALEKLANSVLNDNLYSYVSLVYEW
jgi:hypothetical protein